MNWQRMLRHLVFYAGIITLTVAGASLLKAAHFSAEEAARIAFAGLVSALGGYGLAKVPWRSRDDKEARDKDKSLFRGLTSAPSVILSRYGAARSPPIKAPAIVTPATTASAEYFEVVVSRAMTMPTMIATPAIPVTPPAATCSRLR